MLQEAIDGLTRTVGSNHPHTKMAEQNLNTLHNKLKEASNKQ